MKHMSSSNPSLNRVSSNVTDVSTSSVTSSSTDSDRDLGVKIYDTPAMREEIKKKNETLVKENAQLQLRVSELEGLLDEVKATGGVNKEEKRTSVTFSDPDTGNAEEKEEEEEGDSAV